MTRRASISIVLVAAALAPAALAESPRAQAAAPALDARPRLVLFVSVDQMRADYLERFRPLFSAGLRRLSEDGAVFTNAHYRHACAETGPGHSVLLSGCSPRSSGIVGNEWWDRTLRLKVNVVDDPGTLARSRWATC
jgi:predicted AlkP superfamily pyrophosphatase or phosphodiesterase